MITSNFHRRYGYSLDFRGRSSRAAIVFAASALALSACANDNYPPLLDIEAGAGSSTTTEPEAEEPEEEVAVATIPVDDESDVQVQGDWVDVTSNLLGLDSTCGNVPYVTAHPETGQVIANIATHGLFSFDGETEEWTPIGTGGAEIAHRTQWIEFDPIDPDRYWVSGAYGSGMYRTENGGQSFSQVGAVSHVDRVAVDLDDPDRQTMLVGTHEQTSLLLSVNGGQTWGEIATGLPENVGFTSNPAIVDSAFLIGSYSGRDSGIYRSDDDGDSWEQVFIGGVYGAPVVTDDFIAWNLDDAKGGLAISFDGGRTFRTSGSRPGSRSQVLLHLGGTTLATTGKNGLAISDDIGGSWRPVGPELSFQPWAAAYSVEQSAFFVWTFSCNFGPEGNPVLPESIMRLNVDLSATEDAEAEAADAEGDAETEPAVEAEAEPEADPEAEPEAEA